MIRTLSGAATFILVALALAANHPAQPQAKGGKELLPSRKHLSLPGRAVGMLLTDGQQVLSTEGRSGPPDQFCFSTAGGSYRWVYVPVIEGAQITNLQVPVGEQGQIQIYPSLDLARPKNVKAFGVDAGYALVEIEVNNGQGSPAIDSFVATQMRVLDGTKEFPLNTQQVVGKMKAAFAEHVKGQAKALDEAMAKAGAVALTQEQKITGPRERDEVMYVTWMPETKRLRICFRVKVTDGSYTMVEGGARPKKGPGGINQPPPPKGFQIKTGTSFGVEFGAIHEIDAAGILVGTEAVPFAQFRVHLPPPPGGFDARKQ